MVFFIRNLLGEVDCMKEWFAKLAEDFSRCFIEENRDVGMVFRVTLILMVIVYH